MAAMPGLELLAEVVDMCGGGSRRRYPLSLLLFAGAKCVYGSANKAGAELKHSGLWEAMRASAARVGRVLPPSPPTADQYWRMCQGAPDLGEALALFLPEVTVPLAQSGGLVDPVVVPTWELPGLKNTAWADGTVFPALSKVSVDDDGVVHGSRANKVPREAGLEQLRRLVA